MRIDAAGSSRPAGVAPVGQTVMLMHLRHHPPSAAWPFEAPRAVVDTPFSKAQLARLQQEEGAGAGETEPVFVPQGAGVFGCGSCGEAINARKALTIGTTSTVARNNSNRYNIKPT